MSEPRVVPDRRAIAAAIGVLAAHAGRAQTEPARRLAQASLDTLGWASGQLHRSPVDFRAHRDPSPADLVAELDAAGALPDDPGTPAGAHRAGIISALGWLLAGGRPWWVDEARAIA